MNQHKKALCLLTAMSMLPSLMTFAPITAAAEEASISDVQAIPETAWTITAPDAQKELSLSIWVEEGIPYYTIIQHGKTLIGKSRLGLETSDGRNFAQNLTAGEVTIHSIDNGTYNPLVGEQESVPDRYQEITVPLTCEDGSITVQARIYDNGAAFRYILPEIPEGQDSYVISTTGEKTQFSLPEGATAYRHIGTAQTKPSTASVNNIGGNVLRAMTVALPTGEAFNIAESDLDNYAVFKMENDSSTPHTAKVKLASNVTVRASDTWIESKHTTAPAGPAQSPWRVITTGDNVADLANNSTLTELLADPADEETYKFSEWVEGGACQRAMHGINDDSNVMNNEFLESMVDEASAHGYRYVLLDTGWSGPENDPNCDPRLDPAVLDPDNYPADKILKEQYYAREDEYADTFLGNGEGCFFTRGQGFKKYGSLGDGGNMQVDIDIPALCNYANERGVGIILYVNGTRFLPDDMSGNGGRYRFTPDELFEYFERWGVAGVKPGFVHYDSQNDELYMQEVVEAAAKHHLVMTVHDNWVPTGIERTYPNLLSAEGIFGDEEKANVTIPEDISTLFTRTIMAPADHTFCWPGKATKGYALASPLMFRTGLNLVFWYTNTLDIPDQDKEVIDLYDHLPANWKSTTWLEGDMQKYATVLRQSYETQTEEGTIPSRWYIGSLSAIDRRLEIPLDFLEDGEYVAETYFDGPDADPDTGFNSDAKQKQTLLKESYKVDSSTTLVYAMKAKYVYSVRLTKADVTGY